MHGKSCISLIEGEISDMECVDSIDVSLENGRATIVLNDDCISHIVKSIQKLGYPAQLSEVEK